MNIQTTSYQSERVELKGVLSEFREALEEEIEKIKKSGLSSTLLFKGQQINKEQQIESKSVDFWYKFEVEYIPSLPADTPCKLIIGKEQFDVTVISFTENSLVVASKTLLPDSLGKARLENGATVLMERLIKCIEENAEKENRAGDHMFMSNGNVYSSKQMFEYKDLEFKKGNTPSQNKAINSSLSNDITYIWGPPGTGKTTVIGQIIKELYKHDRSVLVVSHTNTAVDGAIEKASEYYEELKRDSNENYPILRIGTPARDLSKDVLLETHIAILGKELYDKKIQLENQQADLERRLKDISLLLAKDNWIKESQLEVIRNTFQSIKEHQKEIEEISQEIKNTKALIVQEKSIHPEFASFQALSKELETQKRKYNTVCKQASVLENGILELPKKIQTAQDEKKKHIVYAELKERESKYMSVSFLKNEISKADEQIGKLKKSIDDMTVQKDKAQQAISDYERKGSVAKFFSGKSAFLHAQSTLDQITRDLPDFVENQRRQQSLKQEYTRQLESLLVLQEQIRAVVPSKTIGFWIDQSRDLQSELEKSKKSLPDLINQKDSIYKELCEIEQEQKKAESSFSRVSKLENTLERQHEKIDEIRDLCKRKRNICSELINNEVSFCSGFIHKEFSEDLESKSEELYQLFLSVKREIASVDVISLQNEKEEVNNRRVEILRQLDEIKRKMQELEKQAIMNAKIIGATLAKTYLSDTLRERQFDTVILDEASMASIPALWCAAYLAENSIIIVGDFLQLPPIVMADTPMAKKWLGKDIFYHSGMQTRAKEGEQPDNFIMLNDQFRMESDIADIANIYYGDYSGLNSDDNTDNRNGARERFYEWYSGKRTKRSVHLIDTESLHAWVTGVPQGKRHSRLNCFSATVCVDLAFKIIENKLKEFNETSEPAKEASVLIIAPYKPHIDRINQLIELEYQNRGYRKGLDLNFIQAGTIHSFQGSEADVVIFDLVIDEPHWRANLFMTDEEVNDGLRKMFNVAVTRARFKLFIVGNFSYCQKRAAKEGALAELLNKLIDKDKLPRVDAKALFPKIEFVQKSSFSIDGKLKGKHIICREEAFGDYFLADIRSFKKRLVIYSAFMTENRLSVLLPEFSDAVRAGKQIIVVTKTLSERSKHELFQYQKCEKELQDIGVSIFHKKGMHEKLIFVDDDAIWIGSLNALSFTGLTGEIMQRHADGELTGEYEKLFDIDRLCEAIEKEYEQRCPICGGEMLVRESDDGGIYWQCINGDYSRNKDQQYPVDGELRCNKCGGEYIFVMKNEPRWVCSKDPKHFQKMRMSDLKLEKMAEKIPTKKARKEIDKYFANKEKKAKK